MTLSPEDMAEITTRVSPRLGTGDLSLLLGSGFTVTNSSSLGKIPSSDELRDAILARAGKSPGARTTLKDAYVLGQREIENFPDFLRSLFTVTTVLPWQERVFHYSWQRIYTTNIDNVLNVASANTKLQGKAAGEYVFFNYSDPSLISESIGVMPVVTIHGTSMKLSEGFIFSSLEYAKATTKVWDWHRDLAAKAITGGLLVIGNQLDESDLDAYIAQREAAYSREKEPENWIVMPTPDPIKAENYRAAGYHVFDTTAKEFLEALFASVKPRNIVEIVVEKSPMIRKQVANIKAMTWFRASMTPVIDEIENAGKETGILRHYILGAEPEWFYITQNAHAETDRSISLAQAISKKMADHQAGVGILNITGPSGSGKTTTIRSAIRSLVGSYPYIFEFNGGSGLDPDLLKSTIESFSQKSIFIFYSSAEFYYAINYIAKHFNGRKIPFCLFILEDRTIEYARNRRQLEKSVLTENIEISDLTMADARLIALKIEEHGLVFDGFSEKAIETRAKILVDKEKGYGGDLLTALFSLTTHENFEAKIHQEYFSVKNSVAKQALEAVAILSSLGFPTPLTYLAGFLRLEVAEAVRVVEEELAGVLKFNKKLASINCRHRIIADYYFKQCISKHGSSSLLINILTFLSRQFTVADIRHHPVPYRMYKELISFEFLFDDYFSEHNRGASTEAVYHECQSLFGTDGIFWLQFGRFYRKTDRLDEGIDCFRTGLEYFESFQTRHSLGTALLERYLRDDCVDEADFHEGVELLESERAARGNSDPYPTGTLIDWLGRVVDADPKNSDAEDRLKAAVNFGMKNFQDDPYVRGLIARRFRK